jgi:hypothetical protein
MNPPTVEIAAVHEPNCNAGCFEGNHRLLTDAEAKWFDEHPEGVA